MDLIDIAFTQEQFGAFESDVVAMLFEATESDLREWAGRLLAAWKADDEDGVDRARHALKGICGNYGATALIEMASEPLIEPNARDRFSTCTEATIAAIGAVASTCGIDADDADD